MDHRHDAKQLERLAFFSDAVFAIAMTLLVIELRLPFRPATEAALENALVELIPSFFAFLVSFFVIGRCWIAHHRIVSLLERSSDKLIWVNLFVLFTIVLVPFPTAVASETASLPGALYLYAGWLMVLGILQVTFARVALAGANLIRHDVSNAERRYLLRGSWTGLVIGSATLAAAIVSRRLGVALLYIGSPLVFWLLHRERVPNDPGRRSLRRPRTAPHSS